VRSAFLALAPVVPAVARRAGLPTRLETPGAVTLTFDDGPHPQGTPAVLEILAAAAMPATFFLVGEQVQRNPGLAGEIAAAGHTIALHGHRHRLMTRRTARAVRDDLDRGAAIVETATERRIALHRPPYGIYSRPGLEHVRARGWSPLLWSRWGHDWRGRRRPEAIVAEVTRELAAGDVLLLHDADDYSARGSWRNTVAALPRVLEEIAAAGLQGR
jgi:peptidoglycan-N-acetylglucosamine deacetylase